MKTTTAILALTVSLCLVAAAADTQHMRWQDDYNRMDLEIRGSVEFTDNDSDVKSISSDGYFRLAYIWSGLVRMGLSASTPWMGPQKR